MFKKLLVMGSLFLATPAFGATICIDVPDAQMPYVQAVAAREKAESIQAYLQKVVSGAIDSWQKQQDDDKLSKMRDMLQALPLQLQAELAVLLEKKSQEDVARKAQEEALVKEGVVTP